MVLMILFIFDYGGGTVTKVLNSCVLPREQASMGVVLFFVEAIENMYCLNVERWVLVECSG